MGEVEEGAEDSLSGLESKRMNAAPKGCHHQLRRPPDLVTDVEGTLYLVFECLLCGCRTSLRLNAESQIEGEFITPAARTCA